MKKKLKAIILAIILVLLNFNGIIYAAQLKDNKRGIYVLSNKIEAEKDIESLFKNPDKYKIANDSSSGNDKYKVAYNNVIKTYDYFKNYIVEETINNEVLKYKFPVNEKNIRKLYMMNLIYKVKNLVKKIVWR